MREASLGDHTENNPSSAISVPLILPCPIYFTAIVPALHEHLRVYYIYVCDVSSLMSFFLSEHTLHMNRDYFVQCFISLPSLKRCLIRSRHSNVSAEFYVIFLLLSMTAALRKY